MTVLDFVLPKRLEAHEPPEPRDSVRMLVATAAAGRSGFCGGQGRQSGTAAGELWHRRFVDLPEILRPGDTLVVNASGTLPAAVPVHDGPGSIHFSTELDDGRWLVEPRGTTARNPRLRGGATVRLEQPYAEGRLYFASVDVPSVRDYLFKHGEPIRYGYVPRRWPLSAYQTVFATEPGSAEMPSAGRPFTDRVVTRLVSAGVVVTPIVLHTGVASAEAHERPYPERFAVPDSTAAAVNATRSRGGRVIAVGTTVVRALESAVTPAGDVVARRGWTDLVITPERGVRVVDGLLTGFHEPRASHLDLLAAIMDRCVLDRCYAEALAAAYKWHEFGDVNLLLPQP
jgi:S-adenosylmethionine:tRNA ribosyltransferase-isomerase